MSSSSNFFDFHRQITETKRPSAAAARPVPSSAPNTDAALTVSQLTAHIDRALKSGLPPSVALRAEVSNFKHHGSSGHAYFTLKDPDACIDCVMFKSDFAKLKFKPADGLEILATGRVGVYGARGRYQLYVSSLHPVGQGALELAFQQLRAKLDREGLFDPDRKRPLPRYPQHIAILTSKETAALQDILKVLKRFPHLQISLHHVPVQGDGSAEKIAAKLQSLAQSSLLSPRRSTDVILLARGGGSLEDLWEFNEEIVARAIAASTIPVITGIGHEVDVSIADLVADYHAHTPTEAAQVLTAQWRTAADLLSSTDSRLRKGLRDTLAYYKQRVTTIERHEVFRRPLDRVNQLRQLLDDREKDLLHTTTNRLHLLQRKLADSARRLDKHRPTAVIDRLRLRLDHRSQTLAMTLRSRLKLLYRDLASTDLRLRNSTKSNQLALSRKLDSLDAQLRLVGPEQVLKRGYSITTNKKTGQVLRSASQIKGGEIIITRLADGQIESTTDDPAQPKLFG